jgi:hypothetical protein
MAKVSDEELKEIQNLRDSLFNIVSTVGEMTLSKSVLLKEIENIESNIKKEEQKFTEFQKQERVIFEKMQQKYGTGNIDVTTGEILA